MPMIYIDVMYKTFILPNSFLRINIILGSLDRIVKFFKKSINFFTSKSKTNIRLWKNLRFFFKGAMKHPNMNIFYVHKISLPNRLNFMHFFTLINVMITLTKSAIMFSTCMFLITYDSVYAKAFFTFFKFLTWSFCML